MRRVKIKKGFCMIRLENAIANGEIEKIKTLYYEAFPKEEQKPFELISQKQAEGLVEILSIKNENNFCGLVLLAKSENLVLLDYFAIVKEFRGQKIGSEVLRILQDRFKHEKLIIEIENSNAVCENKSERIRRKHFYLKNGLKQVPFEVDLFGVEMEILTNNQLLTFEEYYRVYYKVFGSIVVGKIKLMEQNFSIHTK